MGIAAIESPPVPTTTLQELVMAAHFQVPLPLGVMDLADWVVHFSDYPIVQQLPPAGPAYLPTPGVQLQHNIELDLGVMLPRMLLRTADGRFTVQLQGDRFGMGWARIEPVGAPAEYPGFEAMLRRWNEVLSRFETWVERRFHSKTNYRLIELNYANAAPLEADGKPRRISEIFRFVQPGTRGVNQFNVNWIERVYPDDQPGQPFKGVITAAVVMAQAPPNIPVLIFNFTGMAAVAPGQESKHIMGDLHDKIREIYLSAIADAR
jgi:uncharacterized protein (TIGR04255 family)